ncbi:MAG: S49 family peptidase [Actinomycetota bacterium]|nr:S49 family peptidase [Actinomycetota bacterium]
MTDHNPFQTPSATPGQGPAAGPPRGGASAYPPGQAPAHRPVVAGPTQGPGPFGTGFRMGSGAALGVGLVFSLLAMLGVFTLFALATLGGLAASDQGRPADLVSGEPDAQNRVLAVPVQGVILGHESEGGGLMAATYGYEVAKVLDELEAEDYDGVILEMNTPGGTIYGARAIADAVDRYRERTGNKVVAFVQGLSASGGMYAMAGADEIVADHGTLIGSIGVIMGPFERYDGVVAYSGSLFTPGVETRGGITQEYLTAGKGKDLGNPFRGLSAEERKVLAGGVTRLYGDFVGHVSRTRDIPERTIREDVGAYVYDPERARELRLIDTVGDQTEAYARVAKLNDVDPGEMAVYRERQPGLLEALTGAEGSAAQGSAAGRSAAQGSAAQGSAGAVPASALCTGRRLTLVYYGDLRSLCGG